MNPVPRTDQGGGPALSRSSMGERSQHRQRAGPIALHDEGHIVALADGARVFGHAEREEFACLRIADIADAEDFIETDDFASALVHNNLRVGHGGRGRDPQMVPKIL